MSFEFLKYIHIAYPDGIANSSLSYDEELTFLKEKVDAGADFIVTQLFYDVDRFLQWLKKVREKGHFLSPFSNHITLINIIGITVPVIPGIMPIQTYSSFVRLTKLCSTKVPASVMEALAPISVIFIHLPHVLNDFLICFAA